MYRERDSDLHNSSIKLDRESETLLLYKSRSGQSSKNRDKRIWISKTRYYLTSELTQKQLNTIRDYKRKLSYYKHAKAKGIDIKRPTEPRFSNVKPHVVERKTEIYKTSEAWDKLAKQYEDILNSLYNDKEEEHTPEEEKKGETTYFNDQEEQHSEENILKYIEEEKTGENKENVGKDFEKGEKDKHVEDKLPEIKEEEVKEIEEKIENKEDEKWVDVDEGKNINENTDIDGIKEVNQTEQPNTRETEIVEEEEEKEKYKEHVNEDDKECESKNTNIITSKVQTIKRNETKHGTTTVVFTTKKQNISSLCTSTKVTLVSKTRSILKTSTTGYLKQHNGTLPNFTNITTVVVEESKTFKISSSLTFAFIVFLISTGLVTRF